MSQTRNNHYVPQWYLNGFVDDGNNKLCHLKRREIKLNDDSTKIVFGKNWFTSAQCFYEKDLYSTFFGSIVNDDIEKKLFGPVDDNGADAVKAFLTDDQAQWHHNFQDFFTYLDAQKLRTPKGLDWVKAKYPDLNQIQPMSAGSQMNNRLEQIDSDEATEFVNGDCRFIAPEGGIYDSNVQRLLALSGCLNYDHKVRSVYYVGLKL